MPSHKYKAKRHVQVYQPSDAVSVLAIAATAAILVLSLFAMERFAGVPVSVRGEAVYPEQQTTTKRKTTPAKASKAAQRRAARAQRSTTILPATRTEKPADACSDANCSNLVSTLMSGAPECMRHQQCVDAVYAVISAQSCPSYASCRTLSAMYGFYYANRSCVYDLSATCAAALETAKKSVR